MPRPSSGNSVPDAVPDGTRIGAQLKAARLAARKSMAEVAEQAGLTKGFVSKLERDLANVSVASLIRLCEALDVSVGSLFEASIGEVVRRGARPPINFGGSRVKEYLLTPSGEKRMQAILSDIEPGGGSGDEPSRCRPTWSSSSSWPASCRSPSPGSRSPWNRVTPSPSRPAPSTPSAWPRQLTAPRCSGYSRPPCPTPAPTCSSPPAAHARDRDDHGGAPEPRGPAVRRTGERISIASVVSEASGNTRRA